jgi:hypothetical protein
MGVSALPGENANPPVAGTIARGPRPGRSPRRTPRRWIEFDRRVDWRVVLSGRSRSLPDAPGGRERVRGIEPPSLAWEARALPLSYTREGAERTRAPVRRATPAARPHGRGVGPRGHLAERGGCAHAECTRVRVRFAHRGWTREHAVWHLGHTCGAHPCTARDGREPGAAARSPGGHRPPPRQGSPVARPARPEKPGPELT